MQDLNNCLHVESFVFGFGFSFSDASSFSDKYHGIPDAADTLTFVTSALELNLDILQVITALPVLHAPSVPRIFSAQGAGSYHALSTANQP